MQRFGREAVLAVVGGHLRIELRRDAVLVTELDGELEIAARKGCVAQVELADEAVQGLELFQAVALDAYAKGLAHDGMEVDEAAAAQQPVERLAARDIARAQTLQGGGLVGAEMVDVKRGIRLQPRHHEIDEALARGFLGRRIERPILLEPEHALRVPPRVTGQVLEALVADERIALEVEVDVARRGLGQALEAAERLDRQRFHWRQRQAARL